MSKSDKDTKRLEDVFESVPVYVTECEVKRAKIVDAVNDSIVGIDNNYAWITRLLYALSFAIALTIVAILAAAKNHHDIKVLQQQLQATRQEYRSNKPIQGAKYAVPETESSNR